MHTRHSLNARRRPTPEPTSRRASARSMAAAALGILLGLVLLAAWSAPTARAADQLVFKTKISSSDVTDYSVRLGDSGDRCQSWTKLDGRVTTTLAPQPGSLTIVEPPGSVGPLVTQSTAKTKVSIKLTTTGTQHQAFPCACGPSSEYGPCPPEVADTPLNVRCKASDQTAGMLGAVQRKLRLYGIGSAPVSSLIDVCAPDYQYLAPDDIGTTIGMRLPRSIISDLKAMKVGGRKTIRERVRHAGSSHCPAPTPEMPKFCGMQRFTMVVERLR